VKRRFIDGIEIKNALPSLASIEGKICRMAMDYGEDVPLNGKKSVRLKTFLCVVVLALLLT